jgi:type IV pilus assembly protein PilV
MSPLNFPASRAIRPRRCRTRQRGFTLIESLVTIIVLSIGVLALAILQLQTMVDSRTASMRNIATLMAYNLGDQMRSNEQAMTKGTFKNMTGTPAATATCYSTGCTPEEMANTSFAVWKSDLQELLPGADAVVCLDSTPDDANDSPANPQCDAQPNAPYVIKIWWTEDKKAPQRFSTAIVP